MGSVDPAAARPPSTLWRSLAVRVALIAAVVAIPIGGISFALVGRTGAAIAASRAQHARIASSWRFATLVAKIDALEAAAGSGDRRSTARLRADVRRDLADARRAYGHAARAQAGLDARWDRLAAEPNAANLVAVLDGLAQDGEDVRGLDEDADADSAIRELQGVILREEPRSIVALHAALAAVGPAALARVRAAEDQAASRESAAIAQALTREPALSPQLGPYLAAAEAASSAFERSIDALPATTDTAVDPTGTVRRTARAAARAHRALWGAAREACDDIVVAKLDRQIAERRITITLAALAMLGGMLAVAFVSRYEARRDRLALVATKLETEKMRAELAQLSTERALRLQEARFKTVFDNADLGIVTYDPETGQSEHNPAVTRMLGGGTAAMLADLLPAIRQFARSEHQPVTRDECRSADDDTAQWLTFTFSGVYEDGACRLVIVLIRDTTEEKLVEQQLAYDAYHDGLTGLANRVAFERAFHEELRPGRTLAPFALVYLDLDKFKPINDTFGHAAGDRVLTTIAHRLRSDLDASDLCARIGGDEFALIVRGVDDRDRIERIANRIGASVALPIPYDDDIELLVSASIGITLVRTRDRTADEIKHDADTALYDAKDAGRACYRIFERIGSGRTA